MTFHVQCQVIAACKTPFADDAFEWFGAGVLSVMPGQFIGSSKTPFTFGPLTRVWLLA